MPLKLLMSPMGGHDGDGVDSIGVGRILGLPIQLSPNVIEEITLYAIILVPR